MTTATATAKKDVAEVQAKVDEETDDGYRGVKVDPLPNSAYSLESGPDSPSAFDEDAARLVQHHYNAKEKK